MIDQSELGEVWIESYTEMLPDFIACDRGDPYGVRTPCKIYIKIKNDLEKLAKLSNTTKGSLWNAYAGTQFYKKVQTYWFSNVAGFQVVFDGEIISPGRFKDIWEKEVTALMTKQDE